MRLSTILLFSGLSLGGLLLGCGGPGTSGSGHDMRSGAGDLIFGDGAATGNADLGIHPGDAATNSTMDAATNSTMDAATNSTMDAATNSTMDAATTSTLGDAAANSGTDAATGAVTTLRVHYPAGSHTVTLRGSGGSLNWTSGVSMTAGANDTFTFTSTNLSSTIEWKPLLDDITWARGPNYHLSPGDTLDVYPHFVATSGQVSTLIASFKSTILGNTRAVYAYLPASYMENTRATYPVIYMHDGQNLWAALPNLAFSSTWNVDTAFDEASETGTCSSGAAMGWAAQPLGGTNITCTGDGDCASLACATFPEAIVIGVANTDARIYEYTPTVDPMETSLGMAGGADLYLKSLITELKPLVDSMLRTRPGVESTLMIGSSLGGLVTVYAGYTHADTFGRIGALSPSTWWDSNVIVGDVMSMTSASKGPTRVYVDSGTDGAEDDQDGYMETDLLATAYLGIGYVQDRDFDHVLQQGAQHSETYWAERLPGALQFLLGPR